MGKRPAYLWYPGDWRKDPAVRALSPRARAFWREAIDVLFESPIQGTFAATEDGWALSTGFPLEWVRVFLEENECYKVADVTFCNGQVTLMSRRLTRERKERENTKYRVAKHREKQNVTEVKQESNNALSSSSSSSVTCTKVHTISPKRISDDTRNVFNHWLTKENLIHHRELTEAQAGHINAKLKNFSVDEICESIDNYSEILNDDDYMLNYRWPIGDFMLRGCEKFMNENDPFESYPKWNQEREEGIDVGQKIREAEERVRRRNLGDGGDNKKPPF